MIDLVLPDDRWQFAAPLMEMYHHRKQVFVDQLGWSLEARGSWLEVDEFDNEAAVYLLARNPADGKHIGSVRLLPTTAPHMLDRLFFALCPGGAPKGEDCWEISRLVACPSATRGAAILRVYRYLALALLEFAALNAITRFTLVAEARRVAVLASVGWSVVPLSLPMRHEGEEIQALMIMADADALADMRRRFGVGHSVLRCPEREGRRVA